MFKETIQALLSRGFIAKEFATGEEARQAILLEMAPDATVGIGGSVTLRDLGLQAALEAQGHTVYAHMELKRPEQRIIREKATHADVYLLSCNALTKDGLLVNIDGSGNRITASAYGVPKVIFLVGKNKLTPTLESALKRIKEVAAPKNAMRLQLKTPCAVTGKCSDCRSPGRICRAIMIHEMPTGGTETHVYLVNENLGY